MRSFGMIELKVPKVVMRRLGLGHLVVRLGLAGVDDIGKFDGVLDEEHGNVIADEIPIALLRVELHGKPTDIAYCVSAASAAEDSREPDKDGRLPRGVGQDGRTD